MDYDVLIRNGLVADGSGMPAYQADVGIAGGRIVAIGKVDGRAGEVVDATGQVVAPGFIDPHTHYDAQLFWDPLATPTSWHGFTSVLMTNCGFGIAPLKPEHRDYIRRMLAKVEAMPLASLEQGVPWSWQSYGEYLQALDRERAPRPLEPVIALLERAGPLAAGSRLDPEPVPWGRPGPPARAL